MLLKSLQNATGGSIPNFKDKMQNWIYQPGYPILTVTQKDASTVSITQKRFYTDATTEWYVPLSYTNKKEKLFSVKIQGWLEPNKTYEIKHDKSDWIILNVMQSGFYKVNYDEQLWDNIIAALNGADSKSIHVLNKAQLIDDIFTIARTGEVGYDRAFRLIQFLKNETDYYPWVAGFGAFRYLVEKVDAQTEILLKSMILDLLNNAFPEETKFITHVDKLKEELLESWACKLGQEKCLNNAKTAFQEYKKTGRNPPTNKRETVFCYGLKASENIREDYNYLFSVFKNSTSSNEQNVILSSLGCIKNKDILMEYLELTIKENSSIRQQDFATVFSAVYSRSRLGLDVALSFLEKHFKKIETSYGGVNVLSSLVTGVASKLTTKEQGIVLNKIMKDHKDSEQIKIIVNKVEELISGNERWKTLYGKQITKILQDLGGSSVRWYPNVVVLVISAVIVLMNLF